MLNFRHISFFFVLLTFCFFEGKANTELSSPFPLKIFPKGPAVMDFDEEGPYVFYRKHKTTIKYLNRKNNGYEVVEKIIEKGESLQRT